MVNPGILGRLTLQHLEVGNVGIFGVDVELDSGHGNIEEDAVKDLAEGGSGVVAIQVSCDALHDESGRREQGWRRCKVSRGRGSRLQCLLTQYRIAQPW